MLIMCLVYDLVLVSCRIVLKVIRLIDCFGWITNIFNEQTWLILVKFRVMDAMELGKFSLLILTVWQSSSRNCNMLFLCFFSFDYVLLETLSSIFWISVLQETPIWIGLILSQLWKVWRTGLCLRMWYVFVYFFIKLEKLIHNRQRYVSDCWFCLRWLFGKIYLWNSWGSGDDRLKR